MNFKYKRANSYSSLKKILLSGLEQVCINGQFHFYFAPLPLGPMALWPQWPTSLRYCTYLKAAEFFIQLSGNGCVSLWLHCPPDFGYCH